MQEHRQASFGGEFELQAENALLVLVRREVAEIVEAAFAGGADPRFVHQAAQFRHVRGMELARVMRVDAGRRPERPGALRTSAMAARVLSSVLPVTTMRPTPAATRCGDDVVPVVVEAVVREVEADVDEGQDHARNAVLRFATSQRWSGIASRRAF